MRKIIIPTVGVDIAKAFGFTVSVHEYLTRLPVVGKRHLIIVTINDKDDGEEPLVVGKAICNPSDDYHRGVGVALAYSRALRKLANAMRASAYLVMKEKAKSRNTKRDWEITSRKVLKAGKEIERDAKREADHKARLEKALKQYRIIECANKPGKYYDFKRCWDPTSEKGPGKCPHCGETHKVEWPGVPQ